MSLKTLEIYYNVDGGYWCNSAGNRLMPSNVPRFSLYEKSVLKLHLVRNYGTIVEDFTDSQVFSFIAYDYQGNPVIASDNTKINSVEAKTYWPEVLDDNDPETEETPVEGANTAKGRFAIILNCATIELKDALVGKDSCLFAIEFSVAETPTIIDIKREHVYFVNTNSSAGILEGIVFGNPVQDFEVEIPIGSDFIVLEQSAEDYTLSSAIIIAPDNAQEVYTVANLSIGDGAFKVWFNSTVQEGSHKVAYTLLTKGA